MSKGFDAVGRISDLEAALAKAMQRITELEYLLEKLNEHKEKGGAAPAASAAELRSLLDENVKLKSELSKANQTKGKTDKLLFSMSNGISPPLPALLPSLIPSALPPPPVLHDRSRARGCQRAYGQARGIVDNHQTAELSAA
jgi:hypothetical protein